MANKIYTGGWGTPVLAPAALYSSIFRIDNALREMKIKSIHIDLSIMDATNNLPVRTEQINNNLVFNLNVGSVNTKIGKNFEPIAGAPINTFDQFTLTRAGSWYFDSFFISETLDFNIFMQNLDIAISYQAQVYLLVEIEENVKYL